MDDIPRWADDCLIYVSPERMRAHAYCVVVRPYTFGQYRLQLCNQSPHTDIYPAILREACTYELPTVVALIDRLRMTRFPERLLCRLERPWNCEAPGIGRIRLDNTLEERVELQGQGLQDKYKYTPPNAEVKAKQSA